MAEPMDEDRPEERLRKEVICSVCLEIFKNPWVLPCSHSFCRECLEGSAKPSRNRCPLCRKSFAKDQAIPNRVLSDVCQAYTKYPLPGIQKPDNEPGCKLHMKPLVLYCEKDEQPVCVECVTLHNTHTLWPLSEAVPICKVNTSQRMVRFTLPFIIKQSLLCTQLHGCHDLFPPKGCLSKNIADKLFSVNQKSCYTVLRVINKNCEEQLDLQPWRSVWRSFSSQPMLESFILKKTDMLNLEIITGTSELVILVILI